MITGAAVATTSSTALAVIPNSVSTAVTTSSLILPFPKAALTTAAYLTITNIAYLARRSYLRKMTMSELWKIRTTREPNVAIPLYFIMLLSWQAFVVIFPIVEPLARLCQHCSFFYTYPNANGVGVILEPRNVQHLKQNKRAKCQIRFDWHRFKCNVGDVGRDGFRHPPTVELNLPHIDLPQKQMRHWPWRRKFKIPVNQ
mmetsp:Transcript_7998/g.11636  ORF Transcript_7998/g.11636 Transcript_7998/m.11636 type:complete len:200 (-) Transcript_7998:456-1055(-)